MDFDFSEDAIDEIPSAEIVSQVFNNYILGDHNILGIGGKVVQSITQVVQKGNTESLRDYLIKLGIPENEIKSLIQAIKVDGEISEKDGFGSKVKEWLGGAIQKITTGMWKIGAEVAPAIIVRAITEYYGWG